MCKTDKDCSRGETCTSGVCSKTALEQILIGAALLFGAGLAVIGSALASLLLSGSR